MNPTSRYESDLRLRMSGEVDFINRSILSIRLAAYKARKGHVESAEAIIEGIRREFSGYQSARVFAHINFAEGLIELVSRGPTQALDKLRRSRLLAAACPSSDDLPGLLAAWMAWTSRIIGDWAALRAEIRTVIQSADIVSSEVLARSGLVVANSYHEVRDEVQAKIWYDFSRARALEIGDDATLSAIMFNKASIGVFNLRIGALGRSETITGNQLTQVEASSAENYTHYVHEISIPWVFDYLQSQIHLLAGKHEMALSALARLEGTTLQVGWPAAELIRQADMLRCRSGIADVSRSEIVELCSRIEVAILASGDAGDAAIALHSLGVACASADQMLSEAYFRRSLLFLRDYEKRCSEEKEALASLESDLGCILDRYTNVNK